MLFLRGAWQALLPPEQLRELVLGDQVGLGPALEGGGEEGLELGLQLFLPLEVGPELGRIGGVGGRLGEGAREQALQDVDEALGAPGEEFLRTPTSR